MRSRRSALTALAAVLVLGTMAAPAAGQSAPTTAAAACPAATPSAGFGDVAATNVHVGAINCVASLGIVSGTSTTPPRYSPAAPATRAQVSSMFAAALDASGIELPAAGAPEFTDVRATNAHAANIARLEAAGIVRGRADGTFAPRAFVTRGQLASIAVAAFEYAQGLPEPASAGPYFTDTRTSVHAANIDAARELGLVSGRTATTFEPAANTRRDQLASIIDGLVASVQALPDPAFTLTVLHVNDGESMLVPDEGSGFPGAARFVADMLALQDAAVTTADTGVVTVSSGDNFLAGPRLNASLDTDGVFYDALVYNEAGFDAMTIGNHEFDFGPELLAEFIAATDADIPFLSANLDVSGEPVLANLGSRIVPSTVIEEAGRRIGIVGATYEDLESISSPRNVVVKEVRATVQAEIDKLKAAGVQHILLSSHLQNLNEELELVPLLSGVDAVIGGGGGEALRERFPLFAVNADGKQVPVVTTPGNYTDIGRLILGFDASGELIRTGQASQLVPVAMDGPRNRTMTAEVVRPVQAYVAGLAANVIGTTEVPLDGRRESVRTRETNLGSLLADGTLLGARARAPQFNAPLPDVALQNGGGMRSDTIHPVGNVSELDTFNIAAFVNFTSVATISGDTLAAVMEHSIARLPEPAGQHGQWAGVEFTFDVSRPAGDRIVNATVTRANGTEVDLIVNGTVVAGSQQFVIASINFLFDGGDAYPFDDDITYQQLPVTYQQALLERISNVGTITANDYPDLTVNFDRYDRFGPVGGNFL
jgi:5'-nucleotidase / UDP-sugar diphosphatase